MMQYIDQSNTSGSQENIGKYTGDIARTVVTNAYNYNRTTKMTTLKESNIDKLVIICMVIFFLFIFSSRTAGGKSLRKHKASKRTTLRQVLRLLVALLIGMSLSLRKQTIILSTLSSNLCGTANNAKSVHRYGGKFEFPQW